MKSFSSSALALLSTLCLFAAAPLAAAAPKQNAPFAFSVSAVVEKDQTIERGSTALALLRCLGTPDRKLSETTWLYHDHRSNLAGVSDHGCTTLIVTVERAVVTDLKLVNLHAVQVIAARAKNKSSVGFASLQ